ncbi:MAG: hypothetical protein MJ210_00590 [Alphaproteobacteria bacterium]|nr:hypothetical protein [Alphaproteobacteria bacterium]
MVRVPTYASYMNLLDTTLKTKSMADYYGYQAVSGLKYKNYAGYGMKAANIVNMEASISVTQNFLDNNVVLNTTITTMSTVMEQLESSVSSFKSQMNNSLSLLSDLVDGEEVTSEVASAVSELQAVAFAGISLLSDALNTSIGGKYIFGSGSSSAPTQFPYKTLSEFQEYYDGEYISYPTTATASLASRSVIAQNAGDLTISYPDPTTNPDEFVLHADNGFVSTAVIGGPKTTGTLTADDVTNTLKSSIAGAFNGIGVGDTVLLEVDGTPPTTKAYTVKSVSADGKTITFDDSTPISSDVYPDGTGVTVKTSFAAGTVINLTSGDSLDIPSVLQVKGLTDSGDLIVTTNPNSFNSSTTFPVVIPASARWSIDSESYYVGGSASETFRVSDNQSITLDINANDKVFDKLFRAFGMIAQGNFIKTDPSTGKITNADEVKQLVNEAMDTLQSAVNNNGRAPTGENETLSMVIAKISADYATLNNVNETLEAVKGNLEDSVYEVRNVDKTEAAAKLLEANNSLEASYQVLSNVLNLSLLDYLKYVNAYEIRNSHY